MKKILRTKLTYNCYKREDFEYGIGWYMHYDRSFDMFVTASTKEECERVMESFEDAIRAEGIQDCFDSNIEPKFDEKKKLWIGAVEVYVGNDYVADEKEAIREVYREWKLLLKTTPVVAEAPASVEKNNSEFLIKEIKTLSSGTILSIARQEGMVTNRANWLEAEAIELEWIEFVERTKDNSENWKQSWKKFAKYKDDMFEAWLNDEEVEIVTEEAKVEIEEAEAEVEIEEAPVSEKENKGYVSQEDRVEQKINTLKSMGSTYSVDDGAGTKMMLGFNDGEMWFGVDYCWNRFSSLKLDYQEYILDLVIKERK